MAGQASVDRAAMNQAAAQLHDAYSVVSGLRQRLEAHKAELLASAWKGAAASAFANVYEAFDADFQRVLTAMNGLHERMTGTHARYVATEAEQGAAVSKIAGLLNR
jgi:WXG100 family type VII secretion target